MESAVSGRAGRFGFGLSMPAVAALVYPALLLGMYHASRLAHSSGAASIERGLALMLLLTLVFAVPALALYQVVRLGAVADGRIDSGRSRLVAHLAYASPPLFTFLGVLTYMAGMSAAEYPIWIALWLAAIAYSYSGGRLHTRAQLPRKAPTWLPAVHGTVAAIVVVGFIAMHLINHLVGLVSPEHHIAVMKVLRHWYRNPLVEPVLVALMLFMVASGFILVRVRLTRVSDFFGSLQTATGAYLLLFITGHMNSVFVFQRSFVGKDTDFWFASGGPAGLLGDPWSVRLIPHYALGVWSVVTHAACGLRAILLTHGMRKAPADFIALSLSALAAVAACVMVLALCRVHLA